MTDRQSPPDHPRPPAGNALSAGRFDTCFVDIPEVLAHRLVTARAMGEERRAMRALIDARRPEGVPPVPMERLGLVFDGLVAHPVTGHSFNLTDDECLVLSVLETGRAPDGSAAPDDLWAALLGHADQRVRVQAQLALGMGSGATTTAPSPAVRGR
jgi:hypothetical protein